MSRHSHSSLIVLWVALAAGQAASQPACGDCNADAVVNIVDALAAAQNAAGLITIVDPAFAYCNVSGTPGLRITPGTSVDIIDALTIAQAAAGIGILACGDPCFGAPPSAASVMVPATGAGVVAVDYLLLDPTSDPLGVVVEFDLGGGFAPATMGAGGDGIASLSSSPGGTPHTFAWDSSADIAGDAAGVVLRVTPDDGCPSSSGVAALSAGIAVCNGALPGASFTSMPPAGAAATQISFDLIVVDPESDPVDLFFEYQVAGGGFLTATAVGGSNPVLGAASSPTGVALAFNWDAQADLGGAATSMVEFRVSPSNACGQAGIGATQGPFDLTSAGVPTTLPVTLNDSSGYIWDLTGNFTCGTSSTVAIQNGTIDAYDGGMVLAVDGTYFPGTSAAIAEMAGRQLSVGPSTMSGLEVTRKFFVPTGQAFCRILEIFRNPTGAPINASVRIETNPGSDAATTVIGSSSGDLIFDMADDWVCTDDATVAGGDPALIHAIGGDASSTQPSSVGMVVFSCATTNGVTWTFPITVPAGQTVAIMHYGSQNPDRTTATTRAPSFTSLSIGDALTGISSGLRAVILNF